MILGKIYPRLDLTKDSLAIVVNNTSIRINTRFFRLSLFFNIYKKIKEHVLKRAISTIDKISRRAKFNFVKLLNPPPITEAQPIDVLV